MSQYRLHIDIPLQFTEEEAINKSKMILNMIVNANLLNKLSVDHMNYRLGHDDDRQKSNYMMKNENGHVNNKKCKISFATIEEANYNNEQFRTSDGEGKTPLCPLDKLADIDRELGLI